MAKNKRHYTHRKDRLIPLRHSSLLDEADHEEAGTPLSPYKTKRKKSKYLEY